jgi:hypothetical protein
VYVSRHTDTTLQFTLALATVSVLHVVVVGGGCELPVCWLLQDRRRQPTARVPTAARATIFNGTLTELKYSNYEVIKMNF